MLSPVTALLGGWFLEEIFFFNCQYMPMYEYDPTPMPHGPTLTLEIMILTQLKVVT